MAKKVEIVALVSVLGQPSYDKSRWANFFGEKLAKVTKGKDKIAAINAGASLFKKFVASPTRVRAILPGNDPSTPARPQHERE